MKTALLKHLNRDAKDWWYHRKLREAGNDVDARKAERRSIKDDMRTIRQVLADPKAYVRIDSAGVSVRFRPHENCEASHSGYSLDHVTIAMPLLLMGVPGLDARSAPAGMCLDAPMVGMSRVDDEPVDGYGCYNYAPLSVVADYYRNHGGHAINV